MKLGVLLTLFAALVYGLLWGWRGHQFLSSIGNPLSWPWRLARSLFGGLFSVGAVSLIGFMVWQCWDSLESGKPEIVVARKEIAERVIPSILEDIRHSRGSLRTAALLHFENDPTNYLTDRIRTALGESGILDLKGASVMETFSRFLRLTPLSSGDLATALSYGRSKQVDAVIFGTIQAFEACNGGAKLEMRLRMANVAEERLVLDRDFSKEVSSDILGAALFQNTTVEPDWSKRLLAWMLIVLLLPVFTINFIRGMVRKSSNRANAFTLAIYTAADGVLVYLLLSSLFLWPSILLLFLAMACAIGYNVSVMSFAVKLES